MQLLTFLVFFVFFTCKRGKQEWSFQHTGNEMMKDEYKVAEHVNLTRV